MFSWIKKLFKRNGGSMSKELFTFDSVKSDIEKKLNNLVVLEEYNFQAFAMAKKIVLNKGVYLKISESTGVPFEVVAAIHHMECSLDFSKGLHCGQPWNKKTTWVPKGRGPFTSFEEAAIDAMIYDKLNLVTDWSDTNIAWILEKYNGLGYRRRGLDSPYVWGGTNAHSNKGLYVKDGVFDENARIKRPGCMAIISRVRALDKS